MKEKVTPVFVTGTPDTYFSSFAFETQGENNSSKKSPLYIVFTLQKTSDRDVNLVSKSILFEIRHKFFTSESGIFDSLKNAVEFISREFGEYKISLVLAYEENEVIYLVATGGSSVSLFRNGSYVKILSNVINTTSATGYSKKGDVVILMTRGFSDDVSESDIVSILKVHEKNYLEELVSRMLHKDPNSADKGAIFLSFGGETMQPDLKYNKEEKGKLKGLFSNKKINLRLKSDLEYLDQSEIVKARKRTMFFGIALMIIVLAIGVFGSYRKVEKDKKGEYEPMLFEATGYLQDARNIFEENPEEAREKFAKAKDLSEKLVLQEIEDERIPNLTNELNRLEGQILGKYKISPGVFLDLNLLSESFDGSDIATSDEAMSILDSKSKKIVTTNFQAQESRVVAGPSVLSSPKGIGFYVKRTFVHEEDGIYEISSSEEKVIEKDWEGNVLFGVYSGNIYLLDKQKSQIIRYVPEGGGYSDPKEWTKDNNVEFDAVSDIAIDGLIWTIGENGKVYKYSQGVRQNFTISGLSPQFSFPTKIFTGEEVSELYILDPINSRIVVLTKDGDFVAQYEAELIASAVDFSVSEKEKTIVFLVGDKLYNFGLGHLE